jgi:hypothetical protein
MPPRLKAQPIARLFKNDGTAISTYSFCLCRSSVRISTQTATESDTLCFFCRSFSWALLRANSCARQLRVLCFPGSSLN